MAEPFTYDDVAKHADKKDLYVVIHDKVYDATKFLDEHPGGEEVLLDMAGKDATDAFEDVGHSDEAREILATLLKGKLERRLGDPVPSVKEAAGQVKSAVQQQSSGATYPIIFIIAVIVAFVGYKFYQSQ